MQRIELSREEIDRLIDAHFEAEADVDIPGILATFTNDIEHDIVGNPDVLHGKQAASERYTRLFQQELAVHRFVPIRRLYGDDFVVDETVVKGRATGRFLGMEGRGRPVRFRLLHVFDLRDGLIARETAWLDLAAVQQQLA